MIIGGCKYGRSLDVEFIYGASRKIKIVECVIMGPKVNFGTELDNINTLIKQIQTDLKGKVNSSKIDELIIEIRAKDQKIEMLESRVAILENTVDILKQKCDDNEQYIRRTSLRINNIPVQEGEQETADDVMDKVKQLIDESSTEISDHFLDRSHHVGKPFTIEDQNGIKTQKQEVIVKFATRYHRTLLYWKRKNLSSAKIYIDLTQAKFKLLKHCQELAKDSNTIDFVFADVNCTLCAKLKNETFQHFSSEEICKKKILGRS